ncbi:hypothetical protein PIB30_084668 [Stylosanthes scabra]|uniref:Uncharacterized protein n=1 Tax=Stylosanthes scabra TaxID=79078 RepID=A0ABU6UWB7_9FABA|nr:hypothetical protein [Stylosanthes scabra]
MEMQNLYVLSHLTLKDKMQRANCNVTEYGMVVGEDSGSRSRVGLTWVNSNKNQSGPFDCWINVRATVQSGFGDEDDEHCNFWRCVEEHPVSD